MRLAQGEAAAAAAAAALAAGVLLDDDDDDDDEEEEAETAKLDCDDSSSAVAERSTNAWKCLSRAKRAPSPRESDAGDEAAAFPFPLPPFPFSPPPPPLPLPLLERFCAGTKRALGLRPSSTSASRKPAAIRGERCERSSAGSAK